MYWPEHMFVDLDCGRRVKVEGFYFEPTYAGLLMGPPLPEYNQEKLDGAKTLRPFPWRHIKTHLIPPIMHKSDTGFPYLPPMLFAASLVSHEPDKWLAVVWFGQECGSDSVLTVIRDAIRSLPWDELAEDFDV